MNQIINNLLEVLVLDNNQVCSDKLLDGTIFEPIRLGLLCNPIYKSHEGYLDSIKQIYSYIKENTDIISEEFKIKDKFKAFYEEKLKIKQKKHKYKFSKTGKQTEYIKSSYVVEQVINHFTPYKLHKRSQFNIDDSKNEENLNNNNNNTIEDNTINNQNESNIETSNNEDKISSNEIINIDDPFCRYDTNNEEDEEDGKFE